MKIWKNCDHALSLFRNCVYIIRMKRILLISILSLVTVCSFSLLAQETKTKLPAEKERPVVELTINANRVYIQNAQSGQKLEVFTVVGLKVDEILVKSSPVEITLNVPKGYYILKLGDTVRKVVIK